MKQMVQSDRERIRTALPVRCYPWRVPANCGQVSFSSRHINADIGPRRFRYSKTAGTKGMMEVFQG